MLKDAAALQLSLLDRAHRRVAVPQGRDAVQRPVDRDEARLRRRRLLRAPARQRAVGRLPPVLQPVPVPADADRLQRRLLPAVAARLARGHRPRRRRRAAAAQEGRDHQRPPARPPRAQAGRQVARATPTPSSPRPASSPRSSRPRSAACTSSSPAWSGRPPRPPGRSTTTTTAATTSPTSTPRRRSSPRRPSASSPTLAWDLGANDGAFARIVSPHAQTVLAMDFDHETVEHMYRAPRHRPTSPRWSSTCATRARARGWALAERGPLPERGRPDLTLSLALIHHLSITRNIPVRAILDWLKSLGGAHVIEFPHRDDAMVQRLLSAKRDDEAHPDFNREPFEPALGEVFEVRRPPGARLADALCRRTEPTPARLAQPVLLRPAPGRAVDARLRPAAVRPAGQEPGLLRRPRQHAAATSSSSRSSGPSASR